MGGESREEADEGGRRWTRGARRRTIESVEFAASQGGRWEFWGNKVAAGLHAKHECDESLPPREPDLLIRSTSPRPRNAGFKTQSIASFN